MRTASLEALYSDHLRTLGARTNDALGAGGYEHLVIHSGSLRTLFLDDQSYPFKVNPQFKAWVPVLDNPDCFLVYTPGKRPTLVFNQPVDYWYKPPSTPVEFWVGHFELRLAPTLQSARAHLPQSLAHAAFVGELAGELNGWDFGHVNPAPLLDRLHFARAAKTAYEIECMRRASAIAVRGHRAAERAFAAGESEYRTHMRYLEACGQREEEMPYNNIVAFNANCAVLHYQHLERSAAAAGARLSFLIDAGAQFNGYACDITRTYSARSDDFHHLIAAVDGAQRALCASVRPGVDYRDLHLEAHHRLATVLRDAEVIRVAPDAAVSSGLSSVFFPHGVGHLLGLQVHDVGGFMRDASGATIDKPAGHPYLRLTRRLEPGFVVTIEPGLYFIEPLLASARGNQHARHINWTRVEALRPYGGVRVEDDVVVTASGHENLTRDAFAQSAAAISSPAGS